MRILRITTLLDFGGQEKQYISFTERPELLQNEYVFAAIGYGGNAEKTLRERGFEVYVLNRKYSIRNLFNIFSLYKLIRKIKPDVVHTAAAEANFHGIIAAKLAGVSVLAEEIGVPVSHSDKARIVFNFVYRLANQIIAISENVKRVMVDIGEAPANKIKVVYNPVSLPKFYPKEEKEKFQWYFVSRLIPRKNTSALIAAFARLDLLKRGTLHIVGDGVEKDTLMQQVKCLGLEQDVIFHGFQSEPDKYLSQADIFVLPSFDEGFGIVIIEAMLQKKACLCGYGGGVPEFLVHNNNGWFFNPYSVEDLVEKMNNILKMNKKEIERVGLKAYNLVVERFTVEKYVEKIERVYESVYSTRRQ